VSVEALAPGQDREPRSSDHEHDPCGPRKKVRTTVGRQIGAAHSAGSICAPSLSEVQGPDDARQHRAKKPKRGLAHVSLRCLQSRTYDLRNA